MFPAFDLSNANVTNITALRDLLAKVPPSNFNLTEFRQGEFTSLFTDLLIHDCGTTCCVAGYLCYLPEFISSGGINANAANVPKLGDLNADETVAKFLNIPLALANGIIYNIGCNVFESNFYRKGMWEVTIPDVLEVLDEIISRATAQST